MHCSRNTTKWKSLDNLLCRFLVIQEETNSCRSIKSVLKEVHTKHQDSNRVINSAWQSGKKINRSNYIWTRWQNMRRSFSGETQHQRECHNTVRTATRKAWVHVLASLLSRFGLIITFLWENYFLFAN
jgi:hypothetical protein